MLLISPGAFAPGLKAAANLPAERLVRFFAAALNQNDQQNDRDNTSNNPDNCCVRHVSLLSNLFKVLEEFGHFDHCRPQGNDKDRGKDE